MKNKNKWKLLLDLIMVISFITMYKKNVISLTYHEIVGLSALGIAVVHLILNWKWVVGTTKNIFGKSTPARLRAMYIVDMLLVLCVVVMLVSSVLISKIVFSGITAGNIWKPIHFSMAGLMLVLMGVHLGLHAHYIHVTLGNKAVKQAVGRTVLVICLLACCFGVYSMTTTSFLRWFSMPFSSSSGAGEGQHLGNGSGQGMHMGNGKHLGNGAGMGHQAETFSFSALVLMIAQFASIALCFAMIAYLVDSKTRKKRLPQMQN